MPQKRRFFKRTKTEKIAEQEKQIVQKLQKGEVEFRKIERMVKKDKTPKKRPHFPSNSRVITEPLPQVIHKPQFSFRMALLLLSIVLGIVWNWWVGMQFYNVFVNWSQLLLAREKVYEKMATWEDIAAEYPTYRDAYVEGAIYAYELGDRGKEQYFLGKLQLLDPNFPLTKTFEKLMNLQTQANN